MSYTDHIFVEYRRRLAELDGSNNPFARGIARVRPTSPAAAPSMRPAPPSTFLPLGHARSIGDGLPLYWTP